MAETLLSLSTVLLYGRELADIVVTYQAPSQSSTVDEYSDLSPLRLGGNNFLQDQLRSKYWNEKYSPRLARIYGFSFEGHYYDLAAPAIFLVHGKGSPAEGPVPAKTAESQRYSRAPASVDRSGLGSRTGSFASDLKVWSYDKGDFSIRLDASTGTFEQILLESELSGDRLKTQIGAAAMMRMRATSSGGDD